VAGGLSPTGIRGVVVEGVARVVVEWCVSEDLVRLASRESSGMKATAHRSISQYSVPTAHHPKQL
jgi:hypothetical protein